jgi:hypothetical protein
MTIIHSDISVRTLLFGNGNGSKKVIYILLIKIISTISLSEISGSQGGENEV